MDNSSSTYRRTRGHVIFLEHNILCVFLVTTNYSVCLFVRLWHLSAVTGRVSHMFSALWKTLPRETLSREIYGSGHHSPVCFLAVKYYTSPVKFGGSCLGGVAVLTKVSQMLSPVKKNSPVKLMLAAGADS